MSTLDRIIDARERLAEAHHVAEFLNESLRDLEATLTVDEVARHIPAPRSFTARIREALDIEKCAVADYQKASPLEPWLKRAESVGLMLASPGFQRC